jgi:nucleotide-binding universal stress UspA family protein
VVIMSTILVGVDGSENARRALEWAIDEAAGRQTPMRVTVLTVVPAAVIVGPGATGADLPVGASHLRAAEETAQAQVDKALADSGHTVAVSVKVTSGTPAEELVNATADADLLVVGSRGRGGFARLLMGSVSSQVVQHAACPTVVVPTRSPRADG